MQVAITAASVPEREGGQRVLAKVHQMGEQVSRLDAVWADGGYSGMPCMKWVMDSFRWID